MASARPTQVDLQGIYATSKRKGRLQQSRNYESAAVPNAQDTKLSPTLDASPPALVTEPGRTTHQRRNSSPSPRFEPIPRAFTSASSSTVVKPSTCRNAPLIWINGFPGTGKYTVAAALLDLLLGPDPPSPVTPIRHWPQATSAPRAVLVDNHKLIDAVSVPRSHKQYWFSRQLERQAMFARAVLPPETRSTGIICTDFQTEGSAGGYVAGEYLEAAVASGRPFVPIYLVCQEEERLRRGSDAGRCMGRDGARRGKTCDRKALRRAKGDRDLFVFEEGEGLVVDNTDMEAAEAARMVLEKARQVWSLGAV